MRTVRRHRLWVVLVRSKALVGWLESPARGGFHPPRGGEFVGGFFCEPACPERTILESDRPGKRGIVESVIVVSVVPLGHRRSGARVEARVIPVRPRPATERVPAGVAAVRVGVTTWRGKKRSLVIRSPQRIARLSRIADRLRIHQGFGLCEEPMAEVGTPQPPVVHLSFESSAGAVLAEASQRAGTAADCGRMRLVVRGRPMAPLQNGASLLRAVLPERRRLAG